LINDFCRGRITSKGGDIVGDTLKKQIIRTIALATKSDGLKMNRIIIVTSAGIISGKILDEGDAALEKLFFAELLREVADQYGVDNVDGNDGHLHLTDARIRLGNGADVNIGNIVIFYDQIAGISIGDF
jgi:hypothetical protein